MLKQTTKRMLRIVRWHKQSLTTYGRKVEADAIRRARSQNQVNARTYSGWIGY